MCFLLIGVGLKPCVFQLLKKKQGLLGVYHPRCTIDGEFEKIQCLGSACWCVDERGVEQQETKVYKPEVPDCRGGFLWSNSINLRKKAHFFVFFNLRKIAHSFVIFKTNKLQIGEMLFEIWIINTICFYVSCFYVHVSRGFYILNSISTVICRWNTAS